MQKASMLERWPLNIPGNAMESKKTERAGPGELEHLGYVLSH